MSQRAGYDVLLTRDQLHYVARYVPGAPSAVSPFHGVTPPESLPQTALDDLVKSKPHLARDTRRHGGTGVGPTPGAAGRPMADQVKDILAEMQTASGVRLPAAPAAN